MKAGSFLARCATSLLALLATSAHADAELDELLRQLDRGPTEEEIQFLNNEATRFMPGAQLIHEIKTRDPEDLKALIADLMALADDMRYDPERDMGATPLNTASKRFNGGTLPTPEPLREQERTPGPFSVHRYVYPQSGVPTFAGASVAIFPEDLVAGEVEVAIIGVPNNASSGRRDAGNAPNAMRALNTIAARDMQTGLDPHDALTIVDYGDFSVDWLTTELSVGHVTDMVAETAKTGAIPMLVGGDTSMLYPGVKGVARVHGVGSFGLLQLNAHPDADRHGDHTISDRQSMYVLLDEGIVNGRDTIQFGLRGPDVDGATLSWLRDQEVRYHTMAEIRHRGHDEVLKRVLREVDRGPDAFFVAVDVSVLHPSDMVAAGRIATSGLRIDDVTHAVRHVCATKDIVGFEITDLAPMLDFSRLSVLHANAVLNACINGMAARKAGVSPDYVNPLLLDHGQR